MLGILEDIHRNETSVRGFPQISHSRLCRWFDFETPEFRDTMTAIGEPFRVHRKRWEEYAIIQANPHKVFCNSDAISCLGFGVGTESLPAYFASRGMTVIATDQAPSKDAECWEHGAQLCHGKEDLYRNWCPRTIFDRNVTFRHADMREVPQDLGAFDFIWSSSSLEHLGSLEAGLTFLIESSKLLKPGGIAAHTTEFNLDSDDETHDHTRVCVYRRRDIETLPERLAAIGCTLDPVNWSLGDHEMDRIVDPMTNGFDGKHVHLKLKLGQWSITSLLLVIRKAG